MWIVNLCCDDKISDHSTGKWMSTHTNFVRACLYDSIERSK